VVQQNKKLFSTARKHGVKDFSSFNNAGYMWLYGMRHQQLVNYKWVGRKKLLDKSSLQELVVNLSRITQTKDALIAENIQWQERAEQIHFTVGEKIRKQLQGSQWLLPEDLSLLVSIKIIEKAITQVIVSVSSIIVIQWVIRLWSVTAKRKNKRNKNTYILWEITP
jgi:DNA-damage-inducible protein D